MKINREKFFMLAKLCTRKLFIFSIKMFLSVFAFSRTYQYLLFDNLNHIQVILRFGKKMKNEETQWEFFFGEYRKMVIDG